MTHTTPRALALLPTLLCAAVELLLPTFATTADASPTATFQIATYKQLDQGTPRGTLVSSDGEVLAGLGSRALKGVNDVLIWARTRGVDGTVYFGTGERGRLLAVRGDRVREVADLKTVLVTCLSRGPGNKLLAGTMPGAKLLEIDPKTGRWRQLAKLPTTHIWALLYDQKRRKIFAASGAPGKLFEISASGGKPRVYFDPGEQHLLSLAIDPRGQLLTGGSDKGIIYRVSGKNKASALHDFDATELRRIAVAADGTAYVAVNKFKRRTSGLPRFDPPKKGEGGTPLSLKRSKEGKPRFRANELRPGAKGGSGALYRIDPDGRVEQLIALKTSYLTDVAIDGDGVVWAADGGNGKVYWVRNKHRVMTAYDFKQRQVLALAVSGKERFLGTGDSGAIYRVVRSPKSKPTYETKVLDAKYLARWGALDHRATAKLKLASRSGNTAKPDATWSGWTAVRNAGAGRAQLTSPSARYLQIRAVWQGTGGALRSLKAYYRAQNQRARVTAITFERKPKKGEAKRTIKIKWKVDNPDKDKLVYRLFYREELGVQWRRIQTRAPLTKSELAWNTEPIADDSYRIKVIASDERVNGDATKLEHSRISAPLLVDNRPPTVAGLSVRFPWVSGAATDSFSPIKSIEYAVDGGEWHTVDPLDGLHDTPSETFRFRLSTSTARGGHVIAVRVRDVTGNVGVTQTRFLR